MENPIFTNDENIHYLFIMARIVAVIITIIMMITTYKTARFYKQAMTVLQLKKLIKEMSYLYCADT